MVLTIPGFMSFLDETITVGELEDIRRAERLEDVLADEGQFREFWFPSISDAKRCAVTLIYSLTHEPVDGLEYFEKVKTSVAHDDQSKFAYSGTTGGRLAVSVDLGGDPLTLEVAPRGAARDATPRLRELAEQTPEEQASLMQAGNLVHDHFFDQASRGQKALVLKLMTPSAYTVLAEALDLTNRSPDPLAELMGQTLYKVVSDVFMLKNPFTSGLAEIDRELERELHRERDQEESKEAEPRTGGRGGLRRLPPQSRLAKTVPALTFRRQENGLLRVDGTYEGVHGEIKAAFVISLEHIHCIDLYEPEVPEL